MKSAVQPRLPAANNLLPRLFAWSFGVFLGLSLLKFGNPPIMEVWVTAPANINEFLFGYPWPIHWAYWLLALLTLMGLGSWAIQFLKRKAPARAGLPPEHHTEKTTPRAFLMVRARWLVLLPLLWLLWQIIAGSETVDPELTKATLKHFIACTVCFYLGYFCLSQCPRPAGFWIAIIFGFVLVLIAGWDQHFGGIEATRRYFYLYIYPTLGEVPEGYLKKISSNRIWATLFYPNALAGLILLLLPTCLGFIWSSRRRFTRSARMLLVGLLLCTALACLYWSGSKGGWLLLVLLVIVGSLSLRWRRHFKLLLVGTVLFFGLAGFFWKYSGFFKKGATSVSARFDYWRAAVVTARQHPFVGTGPGTFAIAYQKIKRPEAEMSRLVHNDYLQQASDSGLPGFFAYGLFIAGGLAASYRAARAAIRLNQDAASTSSAEAADWFPFFMWLGVLGWALQSLIEFGLYIPALSWPAFALLGFLMGKCRIYHIDSAGYRP